MTKTLNRWLPSVTLLSWSGILLYFHLSGRLSAFLHPTFRPGVFLAGTVLLLFAIGTAFSRPEESGCCDDACSSCGHGATRGTVGKLLAFGVLIIPLILAVCISQDSFGLATISNRGVITDPSGLVGSKSKASLPAKETPYTEPALPTNGAGDVNVSGGTDASAGFDNSAAYIPKSPDGNIEVSVVDLLYAVQDESLRKDFEGKTVEMVGQLMAGSSNNATGTRMKVVRMFMTCCAADAKPIAALVQLPAKTDIPELSWVRVKGIAQFPLEGGRMIALLKAESMKVTEPPEETMLY